MQAYDRDHVFAAVIGGGPAGAQCALWMRHMNVPCVLFEKSPHLGGRQKIVPDALSNHYVVAAAGRHAQQIASAIDENLRRHGVNHLCNANITLIEDEGEWYRLKVDSLNGSYTIWAKYLVLATGVVQRKDKFIESDTVLIGSADPKIREGNFFRGKTVAILGGGDNAFECYGYLKAQDPQNMRVFARTVRATPFYQAQVNSEDVHIGGYSVFPLANGVHHAITDNEDPFSRYFYEYLIVNYGVEAVRVLTSELDPPRNDLGFLIVDDFCVTKNPRILAIGEASQRMHPCVATSMADGTVAAKFLEAKFNQPVI